MVIFSLDSEEDRKRKTAFKIIRTLIFFLFFFQIFDVIATKTVILHSSIEEANPIVRAYMQTNTDWGISLLMFKLSMVFLLFVGSVWLYMRDDFWKKPFLNKLLLGVSFGCFLIYLFVSIVHIIGITHLGLWGELF